MARRRSLCILLFLGCTNQDGGDSSSCDLAVGTTGGTFEPQTCEMQIISGGASCDLGSCTADNVVAMRDTDADHITDVTLFHLVRLEPGTYRARPADGVVDFSGQLLDAASVARHLIEGEIMISAVDTHHVTLSFDASFANQIRIHGSGTVPVRQVFAP